MATAQMGETRYEVEHPMSPSETPLATEVSETERRIISVWKEERHEIAKWSCLRRGPEPAAPGGPLTSTDGGRVVRHEREAYWRNIV